MKIVINISKEFYDLIQDKLDYNGELDKEKIKTLMLAVDMGKPLPENNKNVQRIKGR